MGAQVDVVGAGLELVFVRERRVLLADDVEALQVFLKEVPAHPDLVGGSGLDEQRLHARQLAPREGRMVGVWLPRDRDETRGEGEGASGGEEGQGEEP